MPKSLSVAVVLMLTLFLAACGSDASTSESKNEGTTTTEQSGDETSKETKSEDTRGESKDSQELSQAEWMEKHEGQDMDVSDVELGELANKAYLWKENDLAGGAKWLIYYGAIENTSDSTVDISNASVAFKNEEDGTIITESNQGIDFSPSVLAPGEIAYVSVYEPAGELEEGTQVSAEIKIDPIWSAGKTEYLDAENINFEVTSIGTLKVTGEINNSTDSDQDDVNVAAGVYDDQGEFLGVLQGGVTVSIKPGEKGAFELQHPPFPLPEEATDFDVGAYVTEYE